MYSLPHLGHFGISFIVFFRLSDFGAKISIINQTYWKTGLDRKNIDIFAAKSKNAIKAALDKYKELPYKEKRSISVEIFKKYNNLLSK